MKNSQKGIVLINEEGDNKLNIVVVGAGAVGMLVASFLSETHEVTLVTRTETQKEKMEENGLLRINIDESSACKKIKVSTNLQQIEKNSIVIVAVKYHHLKSLYSELSMLHKEIPLLFLQNGLAHFDEVLKLPQRTIAFSSCQFGAERKNEYTVQHRGIGVLKIAVERGELDSFSFFHQLNNECFPIKFEENAEQMLFEKAFLNCFINPLTSILQVRNGELIENPYSLKLLKNLYEEMIYAFPEQKDKLPFDAVVALCKNTAKNTSSMLSDRLNGRKTEVETIVGAVIKKAEKRGKKLSILNTLYHIILSIENRGE